MGDRAKAGCHPSLPFPLYRDRALCKKVVEQGIPLVLVDSDLNEEIADAMVATDNVRKFSSKIWPLRMLRTAFQRTSQPMTA